MRQMVAVAQRELRARSFILWSALVISTIPFLVLAFAPWTRKEAHEFVAIFANGLAFNFPIVVALGLGVSMIGTDLSAGRLSFYFSKPISAAALWYGKLLAALVLTYGSMIIASAPGMLYTWSDRAGEPLDRRFVVGAAIVVLPLLFLIAHVLSTMLRARSAVLIADAVGLLASLIAGWYIAKPLIDAEALALLAVVAGVVVAAVVVALVVAGAWQLSRGRTDRLANHIELSKFLWSAIAVILIGAAVFVVWVGSVSPSEVTEARVYRAPDGPWVLVEGNAPRRMDYHAGFLVNLEDGRYLRVPVGETMFAFTFSRDGRTVASLRPTDANGRRGEIRTRSLQPLGGIRETHIDASTRLQMVLSDDGSRIAYADGGLLNVADVATGRSLASVRLPKGPGTLDLAMFFVTNDLVRIYFTEVRDRQSSHLLTSIAEFDVKGRALRQTGVGRIDGRMRISLAVTPDGSRVLLRTAGGAAGPGNVLIADARTGAPMSTLPVDVRSFDTTVLADGRIASVTRTAGRIVLHLFTSEGASSGDADLGPAQRAWVSGSSGNRVVLSLQLDDRTWRTLIVDTLAKRVEHTIEHVRAQRELTFYEDDPRYRRPGGAIFPGVNAHGKVVRINAGTGAVTPLPD